MTGADGQSNADAWGEDVSEERKAELEQRLQAWEHESDHGERKGPFAGIYLTGADVSWLASRTPPPAPVGGVILGGTMPILTELHLEGANLRQAKLKGALLYGVHLEGAILFGAHLEDANLSQARLEGARLSYARLQGAILNGAHLERADLSWAHLEHASLQGTYLESAWLVGASFDNVTRLQGVYLNLAALDQVEYDNANLTVVNWGDVRQLGDEPWARWPFTQEGIRKSREERIKQYQAAARAYRQLSAALVTQGVLEDADRFTYRARVVQRHMLWLQAGMPDFGLTYAILEKVRNRIPRLPHTLLKLQRLGEWFFSWLLNSFSGYGFRIGRIFGTYLVAVALFASAFWLFSGTSRRVQWYQALLVSLTAIHGRVFFEQFGLNSPLSWIAAVESVVGIVIEGVFVAMLVQRFFAR